MKQMECLLKILNEIPEGDQSGSGLSFCDQKHPNPNKALAGIKIVFFPERPRQGPKSEVKTA